MIYGYFNDGCSSESSWWYSNLMVPLLSFNCCSWKIRTRHIVQRGWRRYYVHMKFVNFDDGIVNECHWQSAFEGFAPKPLLHFSLFQLLSNVSSFIQIMIQQISTSLETIFELIELFWNWNSFQFVESLHPNAYALWCIQFDAYLCLNNCDLQIIK